MIGKVVPGFLSMLEMDMQKDRVSAISTTDDNFLRTTRYTNIDGNYSGYSGIGYSQTD